MHRNGVCVCVRTNERRIGLTEKKKKQINFIRFYLFVIDTLSFFGQMLVLLVTFFLLFSFSHSFSLSPCFSLFLSLSHETGNCYARRINDSKTSQIHSLRNGSSYDSRKMCAISPKIHHIRRKRAFSTRARSP